MKIPILIVTFIAIILIKIGDVVIFCFQTIFAVFRKLIFTLSMGLTNTYQVVTHALKAGTKRLSVLFHRPPKQEKQKKRARSKKTTQKPSVLGTITHMLNRSVRGSLHYLASISSTPFVRLHRFFSFRQKRPKKAYYIEHKKPQKHWRKRILQERKQITVYPQSFFVKFRYFIAGTFFSLLFVFTPLLLVILLQNLPDPKTISVGQIPQTTKIYDRNNTLLYEIYASQNRTVIPLSEVPKYLQQGVIAIEDKDFYNHVGFDVSAILRSLIGNSKGKDLQGGSTITQQLIKSTLLTPETKISRKIKEVILAFWAERIYTKSQILEMYFNQVAYGGTTWGVEAASQTYFGKHVKDLNLAECAFLAGLPQAPTIYSPYGQTPKAWKKRQKDVLARMATLGYITKQQEKQAAEEELAFQLPQTPIYAPHFVMYIRDLLVKKYGLTMVERGGLIVRTSLDLTLQEQVQKIVSDEVNASAYLNLTNGAAVVTNPKNGDIMAMVGSRNFSDPDDGNVNVTTSLRQPGSSIKPVTYAAALSKGLTAATLIADTPTTFSGYAPVNYDGKFHGSVPLRYALANSYNIPAVKVLNQIGVPTMMQLAKQMGINDWQDPEKYGLAITLGGAEATMIDMATVYGTFANKGQRIDVNPFLKVTDGKGNVWEEKSGEITGPQVLDPGIAFIMSDILADNNARSQAFGSNSILQIPGRTVSVKTGTTDWKRDNWTIGYTSDYVVATWVGNNDNSPMSQALVSGITGAAPIWSKIMTLLLADQPDKPLQQPENVIAKNCGGRTEYFLRGTENTACTRFPSVSPSGTVPFRRR